MTQPIIHRPTGLRVIAWLLAGVLIALLALWECDPKEKKSAGDKITIVTTTGMIRDAVLNIADDRAEVIALMGPGVDPHLYKATHGDLEKLSKADIVFYNGLHLEGKMGEVLEKLGKTKPVIAVTEGIPDSLLRSVTGFADTKDPHVWFDVNLWKYAVLTITGHLQRFDSANADVYRNRGNRYAQQLDSLHQAVQKEIQQIPEQQRVLITAHDAFGYFGDAYQIEVRGLQGISTVSEFGLRDVTDLVNFIISRRIKAIFAETSVSPRSIQAVIEGCKEKGWNVTLGGNLYSDALGPEGTPEGTHRYGACKC